MDQIENNGRELVDLDRQLKYVEGLYQALSEATSVEQIQGISDKAELLRHCVEIAGAGLAAQNRFAELRIRAERQGGMLLRQLHLRGGRRSNSQLESLNLEKLGIDRNRSSRWQRLARIPDSVFEAYFEECKKLEQEISTESLRRFARAHFESDESETPLGRKKAQRRARGVTQGLAHLLTHHRSFACICVYPPWPRVRRIGREIDHEPDIELDRFRGQLNNLPLGELVGSNAHLHLGTTTERLDDAMKLLEKWGVCYQSVLVCARPAAAYSAFYRSAQEFVLVGTKGHIGFRCRDLSSLLEMDRNPLAVLGHVVRPFIEQVSDGPYLEVFGTSPSPGWTVVTPNSVYDENCDEEISLPCAESSAHEYSADPEHPMT